MPACLPAYLVDRSEGHDEDGDEEVCDGEAEDEVVGHVLQVPLQQDGGDHEHVACREGRNEFWVSALLQPLVSMNWLVRSLTHRQW